MNKPTLSHTHLQFAQASALTQNCKRVCLAKADRRKSTTAQQDRI
jgi:hypothetical protein